MQLAFSIWYLMQLAFSMWSVLLVVFYVYQRTTTRSLGLLSTIKKNYYTHLHRIVSHPNLSDMCKSICSLGLYKYRRFYMENWHIRLCLWVKHFLVKLPNISFTSIYITLHWKVIRSLLRLWLKDYNYKIIEIIIMDSMGPD